MKADDFVISDLDPEYLALVFMYCYERPNEDYLHSDDRKERAHGWYGNAE